MISPVSDRSIAASLAAPISSLEQAEPFHRYSFVSWRVTGNEIRYAKPAENELGAKSTSSKAMWPRCLRPHNMYCLDAVSRAPRRVMRIPPRASKSSACSCPCGFNRVCVDEPSRLASAFATLLAASTLAEVELPPAQTITWVAFEPPSGICVCEQTYTLSSNSVYSSCWRSCCAVPSGATSCIDLRSVFLRFSDGAQLVITACVSIEWGPVEVGHEPKESTSNRSASVSGSFSRLWESSS